MLLFKRTAIQRNGTSRGAGGGQHGSGVMAAIPPDSDITVSELVSRSYLCMKYLATVFFMNDDVTLVCVYHFVGIGEPFNRR